MEFGSKRKEVKKFGKKAGLDREDTTRNDGTELSDEEIKQTADDAADNFEAATGRKANRYKKESNMYAKTDKFIAEHNARLKKKREEKEGKKDKGWFSELFNKVKKEKK